MLSTELLLLDTSVWHRRDHLGVKGRWIQEHTADRIALTPPVRLEILYSARSQADYKTISDLLDGLHQIPCTVDAFERAVEVQRLLGESGAMHHRSLGVFDLLIAAAAEEAGATLWHYDSDYERVAEITGQPTEWIVERGSI